MSPQLADTLSTLRTDRKKEALATGKGEVPELVILNVTGRMVDYGNLRSRIFYKALEKAGLRRIRIHDLRHIFASLLIQNGESLAYVRDQLVHHSIQITVDTYGHLVPGANKQAVAKLDDDFSALTAKNRGRGGCKRAAQREKMATFGKAKYLNLLKPIRKGTIPHPCVPSSSLHNETIDKRRYLKQLELLCS
jgi:hypothetical protein